MIDLRTLPTARELIPDMAFRAGRADADEVIAAYTARLAFLADRDDQLQVAIGLAYKVMSLELAR